MDVLTEDTEGQIPCGSVYRKYLEQANAIPGNRAGQLAAGPGGKVSSGSYPHWGCGNKQHSHVEWTRGCVPSSATE